MNDVKYDVNDMPKPGLLVGLSFQHLFAMFGATVLVLILVGIDPAITLVLIWFGNLGSLNRLHKILLIWGLFILLLCRC